jgi:3-oxoacyl-[acyl-carrier-protein] synthase-3
LSGGQIKKGLLLVGDKSTLSTHIEDKSTYPLFGDAGTATAIEFDANASPIFLICKAMVVEKMPLKY